jgi:hypothetical protein
MSAGKTGGGGISHGILARVTTQQMPRPTSKTPPECHRALLDPEFCVTLHAEKQGRTDASL